MKTTLTEQLAEAHARHNDLEAQLAQANAANKEAADALKAKDAIIAQLTDSNAALSQDVANGMEQGKKDAAQIAALLAKVDELTDAAKTAEQIAAERLGAVAAPPVAGVTVAPVTKDQLWEQYHALTDPAARRAFWTKHKQQLSA